MTKTNEQQQRKSITELVDEADRLRSQKAELALADLANNGGLLTVEQSNTFIRGLIDQPTLLNQCRQVPMNSPSMEINKIGFGKRILRAATSRTALADAPTDGTYPNPSFDPSTSGEYRAKAKPQTSKITLNTHEVIADFDIPYEVLEDNIERGNMQDTILTLVAERAALDLEELLISGDTSLGNADPYLDLLDGALKLATGHVVDAGGAKVSAALFNDVLKALPTKYRRNRSLMRLFVTPDVEQDYRLALSARGTALGDEILKGTAPLPVFGVGLQGAAMMPASNILFTDPQNIIFGIQRKVRIETFRKIGERVIQFVLTARVAVAVEETDAVVKVTNLG